MYFSAFLAVYCLPSSLSHYFPAFFKLAIVNLYLANPALHFVTPKAHLYTKCIQSFYRKRIHAQKDVKDIIQYVAQFHPLPHSANAEGEAVIAGVCHGQRYCFKVCPQLTLVQITAGEREISHPTYVSLLLASKQNAGIEGTRIFLHMHQLDATQIQQHGNRLLGRCVRNEALTISLCCCLQGEVQYKSVP